MSDESGTTAGPDVCGDAGLGAGGNIFVKMYQLVNKDEKNNKNA